MGLSLSVLVALAVLMPGAGFVFGFSRLHSPTTPTTALDQHFSVGLLVAVLAALVAHGIGNLLISWLAPVFAAPDIDLAQVASLLAGEVKSQQGFAALESLRTYFGRIATYLVVATYGMWRAGKWLNVKFRKVRTASWFDLLRPKNASFVVLTADLQMNDDCFLYSGVVQEFSIAKCGSLERVVLGFAARKPLSKAGLASEADETEDPRSLGHGWLEIPGEFVVLQMAKAQTINVDYFYEDSEIDDAGHAPETEEDQ